MSSVSVEVIEGPTAASVVEVVLPSTPVQIVEVVIPGDPDIVEVDNPTTAAPAIDVIEATTPEIVEVDVPGQVGPPGPPGQPGPTGPPGPTGDSAVYERVYGFASPALTWVIQHDLNTYSLVVDTVDQNGDSIEGNVRFVSADLVEVDWYYPTSGSARIFR